MAIIAVVKLAGVYFITIEQGLTGKKDIYPVDSIYTASKLKLTKLGLKEKVKLGIQLATTYKRQNYRLTNTVYV